MRSKAEARPALQPPHASATYLKVAWRILPFVFLCYVVNNLDRANISFAHLEFNRDLGFNDGIFGLGVSMLYLGFVPLEVPSNLIFERFGARKMLMRIMVVWGFITMAMALVHTPAQFYTTRALLGAAEAGFFPGLILYLTYWFPSYRRARITTLFYTGLPIAGVVGGPVAGWIMNRFANTLGLKGWQWMFLLEGLPAVVLGIAAFYYLDDKPSDAPWLSSAEKELIQEEYAADVHVREANRHYSFLIALRDPRSYIASAGYFCIICASATVIYWQPAIIKGLGVASYWDVGLLSAIPFLAAAVAMLVGGRRSDRMLERRWHLAVPLFVATLCLVLLAVTNRSELLSILLLAGATAGVYTSLPIFWAIPPAYFSGPATAGSIALVNTLGVLGGAFNANLIGWTKTQTGTLTLGLDITAAMLTAGAVIILVAVPARVLRERKESS